ncbi:hypothetical protein ACQKGL_20610 [Ensifer adhaerens]|uniref:hypothetical protein n=1 Tax=Ensifer adhaerens TaxID=106592 RepID=UPI003CFF7BDD
MINVSFARQGRSDLPRLATVIAIAAVLLGTFTFILNSRMTEIGLADIRGAFGLGFDEASGSRSPMAEVAAIHAAIWLRGILSPARDGFFSFPRQPGRNVSFVRVLLPKPEMSPFRRAVEFCPWRLPPCPCAWKPPAGRFYALLTMNCEDAPIRWV